MSDMTKASTPLRRRIELTHELVSDLGCTPAEVAIILEVPEREVIGNLVKPCACGAVGCYVLRRRWEKLDRFRDRKAACKAYDPKANCGIGREKADEIIRLRASGMTLQQVADIADVSAMTVQRYAPPLPTEKRQPRATIQRQAPDSVIHGVDRERDPLLDALVRRLPPLASVPAALLRDEDEAWRARRAR